jgi:hypothetical protein
MFNLEDIMQQAQGGQGIQNLARQFGISEEEASGAVHALLPALSAGLQNKTQDAGGIADLFGAVLNGRHQQAFENPDALSDADTVNDGQDMVARMFGAPDAPDRVAQYAA